MESRITHFCLISDFLNNGFDANKISDILKVETDHILKVNSLINQTDWVIQFRATYNNGNNLLISKNKFGSYSSDKIKEITIPIPIPLIDIVPWGVSVQQHTYKETHYDKILNNFWALDVYFSDFSNREDYILDCMRRAINLCFEKGYTVNGIKLKMKSV
jgi:hypothetical protein